MMFRALTSQFVRPAHWRLSSFLAAGAGICLGLGIFPLPAATFRNVLKPGDDTFIRSGFASARKNFGTEKQLEVQNSGNAVSEAFIKFDLGTLTPPVKDARLRLYVGAEKADPALILIRLVPSESWTETTVTSKDRPAPGRVVGKLQVVGITPGWYELDVTSLVAEEIEAGRRSLGFSFVILEESANKIFIHAREAGDTGPELNVNRAPLNVKIVFQPRDKTPPSGWLADNGQPFAQRPGSSYSYGWNYDVSAFVKDRSKPSPDCPKPARAPDPRYLGVAYMDHADMTQPAFWEIALPNGAYRVHLVAGDPCASDSVFSIKGEETLLVDGSPTDAKPWKEGTQTITVTDGRLTINHRLPKAINNKLCFIEIAEAIGQ